MKKSTKWRKTEVCLTGPRFTFKLAVILINNSFNSEYKRLLHEAKLALKKSQRKDYYKILGVDRNANDDEIKKAYKKRALVHHPGVYLLPLKSVKFFNTLDSNSFFFS